MQVFGLWEEAGVPGNQPTLSQGEHAIKKISTNDLSINREIFQYLLSPLRHLYNQRVADTFHDLSFTWMTGSGAYFKMYATLRGLQQMHL